MTADWKCLILPDGQLVSGTSNDLYFCRRGDGSFGLGRDLSIISANGFGLGILGCSLFRLKFCYKYEEEHRINS